MNEVEKIEKEGWSKFEEVEAAEKVETVAESSRTLEEFCYMRFLFIPFLRLSMGKLR